MKRVEIDQQTDGFATKFQVRNDLGLMNRRKCLNRFEFDDYGIFYDQIESISGV